jgi:hypothetical protein
MNPILIAFYTVLIFSSGIIFYQDLKERQVSLWVLLLFGSVTISSVLYFRDSGTLLCNTLGITLYAGFIWLVLKLYLYLKFKKNKPVIDSQLGMADVLVILFIGLTFNVIGMVFFFCSSFIFSLAIVSVYSIFEKGSNVQTIPLAGFLVFLYMVSIIILNLISLNPLIDCSFIL